MTKKVAKIFVLTTIIIMLLIIALLLVYIYKFKDADNGSGENANNVKKDIKITQTTLLNKALPDADTEEVIRGIIFIGDKEDKDLISSAYFVNFDKQENKISFYSFPGDMKFEVSNELYKEISTSLADVPQVLTLSHLYKYSKNKQGLKAGMLMLEDYLELGNTKGDSTFLQTFINSVINGDKNAKSEFVKSLYNSKFTDIKKSTYVDILSKLQEVSKDNIRFISIQGERFDGGVIIKKEDIVNMLSSGSK